ncbi:probable cytochrome P450 318a1 [Drosophila albomicans]|uniref:Probable cytochrome P450 318a1 n=1 Tax=Drosophila albomicans TaxID=7291 RepID=A0A6P8Y6F6_DROAB|nr:probable cytochrome P450 318a1 [Drosophila albomicans]
MHLYVALWVCGTLLTLLLGWQQRKCWRLIWQLNGWRGVAQQPLLWFLLCINLHPNSILDKVTRLRVLFTRPLAILIGTRALLYIDDPAGMECVLNAAECLDKTFMQEGFFARKGLLHARGQKWKLRRKQLNPAFNHNIVISFFEVFNSVGNQLVEQFATQSKLHGDAVKFKDAEDMLSRAVLEVSCLTIMGTPTNFTQADDAHIATTYKRLLEISAIKTVKPWLQIDLLHRLLEPQLYAEAEECNQLLVDFVAQIVQRKHRNWQLRNAIDDGPTEDGTSSWQRRIFIEQMFQLAANGELTLQDIEDEAQSMVLVSFETVSNSIMIALLCLATHKGDCHERLRAEIASVLPYGNDASYVSVEHLQQLRYLDAFVNEALRLLATIPMNLRHVSRDFQLAGRDAIVPQNTIIVLDTFNMQRDAAFWGDRAKQFEPQRFLQHQLDLEQEQCEQDMKTTTLGGSQRRHSYSFLPFSKGLRTCIGRRYSFFIMKVFLVKLLTHFEFHSDLQLEQLQFVEGISLKFRNADDILFQIQPLKQT